MNKLFLLILAIGIQSITFANRFVCDTLPQGDQVFMTCSTFSKDSELIAIDRYLDGLLHGIQKEWHLNGKLRSINVFQNGVMGDSALAYYSNGNLKTRAVQNGTSITLSATGDTLSVTKMRNGKPYGISKSFYPNGNKRGVSRSNDSGKRHGLSEQWREDGTRKDSIVYDDGLIIEARYYYTSGKLRQHLKKGRDEDVFSAVYFCPKGKKVGKVKKGTGTFIDYTEDGSLPEKVYMKNGKVTKVEDI